MAVSFQKFIDRLNRSQLLSSRQLQPLLAAIPNDQRPGNAESLARWLVKNGHLTQFQAKAIYLGHTRGLVVGNYVILDLLGVGGMGQVYKARHRRMKRIVALKLLSPQVAQNPRLVKRFHQEVEAAARLMHPNIVTAFDADESQGKHFLVMEYVPGRDLASLVKERGRLSIDRSIRCILDAARGLEYAHRHGIVHRDVKPSNLLLVSSDSDSTVDDVPTTRVKVLDMGLARIEVDDESQVRNDGLTQDGIVMGTVDFMSPEQAVNTHEADHRSDIYSLGITLHFLLLGDVPFTGRTVIEQVLAHREADIPSLKKSRPEVPAGLDSIFRRMVAKKARDRYASMADVVADLESVLAGRESAADIPILLDEAGDDSALVTFLDSMTGDVNAQRQAAAAVITPASPGGSTLDTIIASDRSTTVDRRSQIRRRNQPTPWSVILLHASWSLALLGGAVWLLVSSGEKEAPPADSRPVAQINEPTIDETGADPPVPEMTSPDREIEAGPLDAPATAVDRRAAERLLSKGASITVAASATSETVLPGQQLPSWPFYVTTITLPGSVIAEDDLDQLAEVTRLEMLQTLVLAGGTAVDNDWVQSLSTFSRLRHLDLRRTSVTDAGLKALPEICPKLEVLQLAGCGIDGSGLESLARLPWLRELDLSETPVSDSALGSLTRLTSLRRLDLRRTSLSAARLDELRKMLPDCQIPGDE